MTRTFRYGDTTSQAGDLWLPRGARPAVVCLLHGGFWRMPFGREETAPIAADLASRGYAVWNVEYRRVGEAGGGWPGTLDDVAAAIDHLAELASGGEDLDLARVALVGHSAGGHLALRAAARGDMAGSRFTPSRVVPVAAAGLAAVTDLARTFALDSGGGATRAFLGGSPDEWPDRYAQASPIGLVPLEVRQLILHGTEDDALPVGLSRAYVRAALLVGDDVDYVELDGASHMDFLDPASGAHAELCAWLDKVLPAPVRFEAS